jgi:hypothetical protein
MHENYVKKFETKNFGKNVHRKSQHKTFKVILAKKILPPKKKTLLNKNFWRNFPKRIAQTFLKSLLGNMKKICKKFWNKKIWQNI